MWVVSIAIFDLSLMSGGGSGRRLFVRHGFLDRLLDDSRVGEVGIGERRQRGADQAGDEIDGDVLGPEGRAARDRPHELGAERARRGEWSTRDGAEGQA